MHKCHNFLSIEQMTFRKGVSWFANFNNLLGFTEWVMGNDGLLVSRFCSILISLKGKISQKFLQFRKIPYFYTRFVEIEICVFFQHIYSSHHNNMVTFNILNFVIDGGTLFTIIISMTTFLIIFICCQVVNLTG